MTSPAENKVLACRYLELIAKGDADGVADLFTENGTIIVESRTLMPPEVRGRENIRALIGQLPNIFPETGLRIFVDDLTAEGDRVAVRARSDAIHMSGKKYCNRYHFLLRFENGKIAASHEYLDSLLLTDVFFGGARPDPE